MSYSEKYEPKKFRVEELERENVELIKTYIHNSNPRPSLYDRKFDDEDLILPMGGPNKIPKDLASWEPRKRKSNFKVIEDHLDIFGRENVNEDWAKEFWENYKSKKTHGVHKYLPRKTNPIRPLRQTQQKYGKRMQMINREVRVLYHKVYAIDAKKKLRKRKHVYQEVLSTERTYVESLELFMEHYINPMEGIARPELYQGLKQSISNILGINTKFLIMVEKCFENLKNEEPIGIEDVFKSNAPVFKLYVQFMEKYGTLLKLVKEEEAKNEQFKLFCTSVHNRLKQMGHRATTVKSFLIMPVQRLPRYKLLLGEILKKTPKKDKRSEAILLALKSVEGIADYINMKKKEILTRMKATELYERFKLKDLVHSSRKLKLFSENVELNGTQGEIYCFNDLLVLIHKGKLHRIEPGDSAARCLKDTKENATEEEKENCPVLLVESERFECSVKFENGEVADEYLNQITDSLKVEAGTKTEVREMYHGWLRKEGGGRISKGLKKRWHVLSTDKKMRYYGKKGGKMKGSYSVENSSFGLSRNREYQFGFYVKTDKRVFYMRADSEENVMDWFTVLGIAGGKKEKL